MTEELNEIVNGDHLEQIESHRAYIAEETGMDAFYEENERPSEELERMLGEAEVEAAKTSPVLQSTLAIESEGLASDGLVQADKALDGSTFEMRDVMAKVLLSEQQLQSGQNQASKDNELDF